jgi:hypothetical protein
MDKLGLRTTANLTQYAIKSGVISIQMPSSDGVIENKPSAVSKAMGAASDPLDLYIQHDSPGSDKESNWRILAG